MGSRLVRTTYRGLLVGDSRLLADVITATSEAGPLPGIATATNTTDMALDTSGTVTLTADVAVRSLRGGMAEPDGATFGWRLDDPGEDWRGWDAPIAITSSEYVNYQGATGYWRHPHAVTLDDGRVLVVAGKQERYTTSWTRALDGTWSDVLMYNPGAAFTVADGPYPCLVKLPTGRVLCFFWRELSATSYQVMQFYTDDAGATWTMGQRSCLAAAIDTTTNTPKRLRAAYLNGQVLLLAHIEDTANFDELWQYASVDKGCSFTLVDTLDASPYGFPEVVNAGGVLVVAVITNNASAPWNTPKVARLASAHDLLSSATWVEVSGKGPVEWASPSADMITVPANFTNGELALWLDDDGTLYLAGTDVDNYWDAYTVHSFDGGVTWDWTGHGGATGVGATWWRGGASTYIRDFSITPQAGRAMVMHAAATSGAGNGEAPYSLFATTLGGFTTVTLPMHSVGDIRFRDQIGWESTWLPFDFPDAGTSPYTAGVAGAPTLAITADGMEVLHGAGADSAYWTASPTTTDFVEGLLFLFDTDVADGETFISLRTSDGANHYEGRVAVSATQLVLRDLVAGADITTTATVLGATGVQILLAVGNDSGAPANDGQVQMWYRARDGAEDRAWESGGTSGALQQGAVATSRVQWGTLTGYAAAVAYFRIGNYGNDQYTGVQLYAGQTNPDDLLGRPLSIVPTWVTDGLHIASSSGPTQMQDVWDIPARFTYGITNIAPDAEPSPAKGWRSTDTSAQSIIWQYSASVAATTRPLSPVLALHLARINWRLGSFWGRNSLGTWVKLADIDTADGQTGLDFTRKGDLVLPAAGGSSPHWALNQLAGAIVDFDGTDQRRVLTNAPGSWQTDTMTCHILVDGGAGAPASGTDALIIPRDYTLVLPVGGETAYSAYKLIIDSQTTVDGYLAIGNAVLGGVFLFASEYDWGRALDLTPNYTLTEGRAGSRRVRKLGAARRGVELPWNSEMRTRGVFLANPHPDYYAISNTGNPWGMTTDTPHTLLGLLELLGGATSLAVYLPNIPTGTGVSHLNHPTDALYGRVRTEVMRLDNVQGTENADEVFRGSVVRIEEEL